ncbi:MAG: hypothetical protein OEL69_07470, partial [Nitrosopumilus sp.]|nr:hypothetical protein [Nitrosopumilus sp.]
MNNEIGRKITSLTLMTIMIAGGLTFAVPGVMPAAHAANANLFVSAENSQFDNYMSGPQVIEVVVIDSDINDTDEAKGEPDVTVNGKILRMVQAVDGNWYGYFADRKMAQIADSTAVAGSGVGLDFGQFCSNTSASVIGVASFSDTNGVAFPTSAGGIEGSSTGAPITHTCTAGTATMTTTTDGAETYDGLNVVREAKAPNIRTGIPNGQIGIEEDFWPFVQLYTLNPTGNVVIQYNKGGGVQTTSLTFDTVDNFASSSLDRAVYPPGSQIHATITDLWLNIDPTDEDSWTFGTVGTISTNYQVFDENGGTPGDVATNTDTNLLTSKLSALMCEDNCVLRFNPDVQNKGIVATLQDNDDSEIVTSGDPNVPTTWTTNGGFLAGNVPMTITEQGPNSGVFGSYDESDTSNLIIRTDAARGTSASIDYNETPVTILVGLSFATVDIMPIDDEWSSGEEIPIKLVDGDANKNSRADEDLDLNDPNTALIPSLKTGTPATLSGLSSATLDGVALTNTVQGFSDRAILTHSSGTLTTIDGGDTLVLNFGTMKKFFDAAPVNKANFHGYALFNYDVRSLANDGNIDGITSVDITLPGAATFTAQPLQGLIVIDNTQDNVASPFSGLATTSPLSVTFTLNGPVAQDIALGTQLPVVADIFGFGFLNDGLEDNERIANQIIRLELEETGDNTSTFEGTLEYTMINQLNILDQSTYEGLDTISDEASFIVIEDLDDEESPRVNYFDKGADGVSTQVADQEEAPSHSGIVSFDLDTYKTADTVTITLEDLDLNVDSDLIDIYTVVSGSSILKLNDVLGSDANPFELSDGDRLSRVLDVTFDDQLWTAGNNEACTNSLAADNIDTGLAATGFTLIETDRDSGVFVGDFQIPAKWCRAGASTPESVTGLDIEVNYVDFRDAAGEIIEVGDSAGIRANTGSVSLDRTVYPVPFGVPANFGDVTGDTSPDNRSIFAIHATGINTDLTQSGSFLPNGDLTVHIRVNDPDFDVSASGEDRIAQNTDKLPVGPVKVSIIRGAETVILGFAGGPIANDGRINVGTTLVGDGQVSDGEIIVTSSTPGFGGVVTSGSAGAFTTGTTVTINQGSLAATALFTDNAANGIDSGNELSDFAGLDLASFTNGAITIDDGSGNVVAAIFTDAGATGLGSGSEITNVATFATGSVLICQTGMSQVNCATGTFVNIGTGSVAANELKVVNADNNMTPGPVTLVQGANTATASWADLNGDTNIDDGELTITNGLASGTGFVDTTGVFPGLTNPVTVTQGVLVTTLVFTDKSTTLETGELTISPDPSGIGFTNGDVTITPIPTVSGVSATGTFTDGTTARQFGPMDEIAPDAGIFEFDLEVKYTDGPADSKCPQTVDFDAATAGIQGELTRFTAASPSNENYCILQGDILQIEYTDPIDASGDENTVTDSATFDLRNGVLQSDKSVYIIGSDMILTLIEPDLDLDND